MQNVKHYPIGVILMVLTKKAAGKTIIEILHTMTLWNSFGMRIEDKKPLKSICELVFLPACLPVSQTRGQMKQYMCVCVCVCVCVCRVCVCVCVCVCERERKREPKF